MYENDYFFIFVIHGSCIFTIFKQFWLGNGVTLFGGAFSGGRFITFCFSVYTSSMMFIKFVPFPYIAVTIKIHLLIEQFQHVARI